MAKHAVMITISMPKFQFLNLLQGPCHYKHREFPFGIFHRDFPVVKENMQQFILWNQTCWVANLLRLSSFGVQTFSSWTLPGCKHALVELLRGANILWLSSSGVQTCSTSSSNHEAPCISFDFVCIISDLGSTFSGCTLKEEGGDKKWKIFY